MVRDEKHVRLLMSPSPLLSECIGLSPVHCFRIRLWLEPEPMPRDASVDNLLNSFWLTLIRSADCIEIIVGRSLRGSSLGRALIFVRNLDYKVKISLVVLVVPCIEAERYQSVFRSRDLSACANQLPR